MSDEINDLHKQIKSLMNETVGGAKPSGGKSKSGMKPAERRMLSKARQAFGPYAGTDWRKAAV
jgi:hypothetical protein